MCRALPFLYSVSGCDKTSGVFVVSKASVLNMFMKNEHFRHLADIFTKQADEISLINGNQALVFGGEPLQGLDILRFQLQTQLA